MTFVTQSIESTSRTLALNATLVGQVRPPAGGWILPREFKILLLTMHIALQLDLAASVPIDSSTKS